MIEKKIAFNGNEVTENNSKVENNNLTRIDIENSSLEVSEKYEKYKNKFLKEVVFPYAEDFDYQQFSDNKFMDGLEKLKLSYEKDGDTYHLDARSFSTLDLDELWSIVDYRLLQRKEEIYKNLKIDEINKLDTGKWTCLPSGEMTARAKNPCVTGGVHGDETTLPNDIQRALESQRAPLISINSNKAYVNWKVNSGALENSVRSYSVSEDKVDVFSDMNRPVINDPVTQLIKEKELENMTKLSQPFLLDCHNDNYLQEGENSDKLKPFAYITDTGDIEHKLKLASELGLHRAVIVPQAAMNGTMVESLMTKCSKGDGITIEVNGNDNQGTSAKIALRFLQLSEGLDNGSPSNGVKILNEFQTRFLEANPDLKIFKMEVIEENKLGESEEAHYMIINEKPIKVIQLTMKGDLVPMSDQEKNLFN